MYCFTTCWLRVYFHSLHRLDLSLCCRVPYSHCCQQLFLGPLNCTWRIIDSNQFSLSPFQGLLCFPDLLNWQWRTTAVQAKGWHPYPAAWAWGADKALNFFTAKSPLLWMSSLISQQYKKYLEEWKHFSIRLFVRGNTNFLTKYLTVVVSVLGRY